MPSQSEIIEALQFDYFHAANPINGTGDPAFTITYQFETDAPADDWSGLSGWASWTNPEKDAVRAALAHIESFLNIDFVEIEGQVDADLSLGLTTMGAGTAGLGGASLATYSDGSLYDYDAFAAFNKTLDLTDNLNLILHELGHALGLDHPFEGVALAAAYDTNHYTVMSYTPDPESGENNDAMMLFDVYALQDIWGAADYNTGDDTYTGSRTDNVDTVWDTGGTDTFDASARTNAVRLDLRDGAFSTFGSFEDVAIAYGVTIENAVGGAGDDTLIGNEQANDLSGNGGSDVLKGNTGKDTLDGGGGKDRLKGGSGTDTLAGGGGKDKLYGGGGTDTLEGGSGTDRLWGDGGEDTFRFLTGADKDVVRDFESGLDSLEIIGLGTLAEVLAAATEVNGHVFFDFGNGDILVVKNMTLDALESDVSVI